MTLYNQLIEYIPFTFKNTPQLWFILLFLFAFHFPSYAATKTPSTLGYAVKVISTNAEAKMLKLKEVPASKRDENSRNWISQQATSEVIYQAGQTARQNNRIVIDTTKSIARGIKKNGTSKRTMANHPKR